jgi:hypothetical protein
MRWAQLSPLLTLSDSRSNVGPRRRISARQLRTVSPIGPVYPLRFGAPSPKNEPIYVTDRKELRIDLINGVVAMPSSASPRDSIFGLLPVATKRRSGEMSVPSAMAMIGHPFCLGTAIGTGINSPSGYSALAIKKLAGLRDSPLFQLTISWGLHRIVPVIFRCLER